MTALGNLVRAATRPPGEWLTVLYFPVSKGVDAAFFATGHRFVCVVRPDEKTPDLPAGVLPVRRLEEFPHEYDLDAVVCPHEEAPLSAARLVAVPTHVPVVCVWAAAPAAGWTPAHRQYAAASRGDVNVFATAELRDAWGVPDGLVAAPPAEVLERAARLTYVRKH